MRRFVPQTLPVWVLAIVIAEGVAILVLAAGAAKEGPGPLVTSVAGKAAAFPIPVTIVPYNLTDEDIDSLA